jgi:hypothetical protein
MDLNPSLRLEMHCLTDLGLKMSLNEVDAVEVGLMAAMERVGLGGSGLQLLLVSEGDAMRKPDCFENSEL